MISTATDNFIVSRMARDTALNAARSKPPTKQQDEKDFSRRADCRMRWAQTQNLSLSSSTALTLSRCDRFRLSRCLSR